MTTTIHSAVLGGRLGSEVFPVEVTTHPTGTDAPFTIEGFAPTKTKEAVIRTRSALGASGYDMDPRGVVVRISGLPDGASTVGLDLPIALALLGQSSTLAKKLPLRSAIVVGELGLDGTVRKVRGALAMAVFAHKEARNLVLPMGNIGEAIDKPCTFAIGRLDGEIVETSILPERKGRNEHTHDMSEVPGNADALAIVERTVIDHLSGKRALLLLEGAPGTGKTMIARRIPGILPELATMRERIDATLPYSCMGLADRLLEQRPFRAPHYTISASAMAGLPKRSVGEVHLASHGLLFLDELIEFPKATLRALWLALDHMPPERRPMIAAAVNPCPCGFAGHPDRPCACSPEARRQYAKRLDAILEDFGMPVVRVTVEAISLASIKAAPKGPTNESIRARIAAAVKAPKQIHLRTDPDNAPAKPMECGDVSMPASLYDIPPEGQYKPGEVCETCIDKRRERMHGKFPGGLR